MIAAVVGLLLCAAGLGADPLDLATLSLEELMDVEVALTSRKAEPLFEAPAAVAVLTADDLRRAGVTSIPEALRLVPGMVVAHVDANKWAVSARGFNGVFANKLLVLIDGRSVYTPTFSGVYWALQNVLLTDVERIEVVRGPGATLWGSNAVNGIVNIVTRSASDTQGTYAHAGGGSAERAFAEARHGGTWGADRGWRVWGRSFTREARIDSVENQGMDDWWMARGGFRIDDASTPGTTWTVQGDAYRGSTGQTFRFVDLEPPYRRVFADHTRVVGGNLLGRWQRDGDDGSLRIQGYVDHTERTDALLDEDRSTADLDLQHSRRWHPAHELAWGLGYRYTRNDTRGSIAASLTPSGRAEDILSAFLQSTTSLADDRLRLVVGSKIEHNDHTGMELQPSARLWWQPRTDHAVWAAATRAARVPAQADEDVRLNLLVLPPDELFDGSPVALGAVLGSRAIDSEKLYAVEVGYRARLRHDLWLDVAAFHHTYRDLRSGEPGVPIFEATPAPPHLLVPYRAANGLEGESRGVEVATDWRVVPERWRLRASWSYKHADMRVTGDADPRTAEVPGENPEHQAYLWSAFDLARGWQADAILRYVDHLPTQNNPAYLVADLRLGWELQPGVELELVGRNLLERHHSEFRAFFVDTLPTQTPSEVYAGLRWRPR